MIDVDVPAADVGAPGHFLRPAVGITVIEVPAVGARVLALSGEIDAFNSAQLWERLIELVPARSPRNVVLDLTETTFISAAALRVVDSLVALAAAQDIRTSVAATPGTIVARVLELVPISEPCRVFATVSEALTQG